MSEKHIRFEYDINFWGGGYSFVGNFVYVPLTLCEKIGCDVAFTEKTGIDKVHIIHYTVDEHYREDGSWFS